MSEKISLLIHKIADCMLVSIYWVVLCLPVVTAGAATTSLYYVTQKNLRNDRGYASKEFWHAFKSNFKVFTLSWLIMLVFGTIFAGNGYLCYQLWRGGDAMGWLWILCLIMGILDLALALVAFPYMARFEDTVKMSLRNTILITLRHLPLALLQVLMLVIFVTGVYLFVPLILIAPAGYMLLSNRILEKIFRKYMSPEDIQAEEKRNGC